MAPTLAQDRRVSGTSDRRLLRRGGRRKDDDSRFEFDLRVACEACGVGWALIRSFTYRGQSMLCFVCPHCGHLEKRVGPA
jgi:hypothetical protein